MQAIRIMMHALRQVFGNLRQALMLSAIPVAIQFALVIAVRVQADQPGPAALLAMGLAMGLAMVISFVWIAVRWHRFVLLNEQGLFRPPSGAAMLRYVGVTVLTVLVMIPPSLAMWLVFRTLVLAAPPVSAVVLGAGAILTQALALILGTALPGAAIGAANPLRTAWRALSPAWGTVLALTIPAIFAGSIIEGLSRAVASTLPPVAAIGTLILYWLSWLIGLSVLTTLWGHYVEGRPLR